MCSSCLCTFSASASIQPSTYIIRSTHIDFFLEIFYNFLLYICNSNSTSIGNYYTLASVISDIAWVRKLAITCLFLMKQSYSECTKHAAVQCYWNHHEVKASPSKHWELSERDSWQVATQPFCPSRRQPSYQKDICDCHWRKVASQMYQPKH